MAQSLYCILFYVYIYTYPRSGQFNSHFGYKKKGFLYINCSAGRPPLPVGSQPLTEQVQRCRRLPLFGGQYIDRRILANSPALRKPVDLPYYLLAQRIPLQFGSAAGTPPGSPPLIQSRN